jgi:hypothetical protein
MPCPNGGLIYARHDEIKYELGALYKEATSSGFAQLEPAIFPKSKPKPADFSTGITGNAPDQPSTRTPSHEWGDLLLRNLFSHSTDSIIDVSIIDLNCTSYRDKDYEKVLRQKEDHKKRKYLKACQVQRRHFAPFVASTDGVLAREAKATILKCIAKELSQKWQQPYSSVMSYVTGRISISLARTCHRCLHGAHISHLQTSYPFKEKNTTISPTGDYLLAGPF